MLMFGKSKNKLNLNPIYVGIEMKNVSPAHANDVVEHVSWTWFLATLVI